MENFNKEVFIMRNLILLSVYVIIASCFIGKIAGEESVPELIRKKGYPCEIHQVITEDGYILTLHRIPHGKLNSPINKNGKRSWWRQKTPVVMQHGLLSSSSSWVLSSPHKAPAYLLVDAGYDVWMPNIRGSKYSKNHVNFTVDSEEFWNFSWDEMAMYDFPAFIDYVLNQTNQQQLFYIGHSMGTTIYFAGMSNRPEYNNKIKRMYGLGPVATVGGMKSYIGVFAYVSTLIKWSMEFLGDYEFMPQDSLVTKIMKKTCATFNIVEYMCENLLFLITGFDSQQFNQTWLPVVTDELLSGTSIYTVLHYSQEYLSGKFCIYDNGWFYNWRHYGHLDPPEYNLKNVTSKVNLLWGINDYLADTEDVNYLLTQLPNRGRICNPVQDPNFNHLDFLWAREAKELVYDPIIKDMKEVY